MYTFLSEHSQETIILESNFDGEVSKECLIQKINANPTY
jgi:hypothetical protein